MLWYHYCSKANDFISFLMSQFSLVFLHFSLATITLAVEYPVAIYNYETLVRICKLEAGRMPRVGEIKDDDLKKFFNMLEADNIWNIVIVNNTFEFLLVNQGEDTNRDKRRWDIQTVPKVGKPSVITRHLELTLTKHGDPMNQSYPDLYHPDLYHPVCISGKCQ